MNSFLKSFLTGGAILLLTIAGSSVIEAKEGGTGVGNGGDAVVCYDASGGIKSVEFFDLFEMRMIYDRALKLEAGTPLDKVRGVARKISRYFPNLAKEMIDHAEQFTARTEWVRRDLEDIPDAGDVIFPSGCRIKQVIIRSKQLPYPGKLFEIDQRLWERMDVDSRAAAILHEFIYGLAVDRYGHSNSVASRRVNAELMSDYLGEPGAWVDWVHLFASQKIWVKLDPSRTVDSGSPFEVPEPLAQGFLKVGDDRVSVWGTLPMPMDFSTSQGERRMAPGKYRLVKSRMEPKPPLVLAEGGLRDEHRIQTRTGEIFVGPLGSESKFSEIPRSGLDTSTFVVSSSTLRFEKLAGDRFALTSDLGCEWRVKSMENGYSFKFDGSWGRIWDARGNPCRVSYFVPEFSLENAYPEEASPRDAQFVGGRLKWIHGERDLADDVNVTLFEDGGFISLMAMGPGALPDEGLGRLPELKYGEMIFRDLPIRWVDFWNGIPVNYGFHQTNVTFSPRDGLTLSGPIDRYVTDPKFPRFDPGLSGDFKILRLDRFSPAYLGEVSVKRVRLIDRSVHLNVDWREAFHGTAFEYVKRALRIPYFEKPKEVPLRELLIWPRDGGLEPFASLVLPLEGELEPTECTDTPIYLSHEAKLVFTSRARSKLKRASVLGDCWNASCDNSRVWFEGCLTKNGFDMHTLEIRK